jgi:hypothetical protein
LLVVVRVVAVLVAVVVLAVIVLLPELQVVAQAQNLNSRLLLELRIPLLLVEEALAEQQKVRPVQMALIQYFHLLRQLVAVVVGVQQQALPVKMVALAAAVMGAVLLLALVLQTKVLPVAQQTQAITPIQAAAAAQERWAVVIHLEQLLVLAVLE